MPLHILSWEEKANTHSPSLLLEPQLKHSLTEHVVMHPHAGHFEWGNCIADEQIAELHVPRSCFDSDLIFARNVLKRGQLIAGA